MQILLKLNRCFGHGLTMCMWFEYNTQIIFCNFFHKLNLVIFQGIFAFVLAGNEGNYKISDEFKICQDLTRDCVS